jgi:transcriptional regulator with XRE-family HTH domain
LPRKLGNLRRIRSEHSLTVEEFSKASGVPRSTIVGLEEGTRKAQQVTIDRLAKALDVEAGELTNDEGVTILKEREGNRVRVVRRYDDYTLEISYHTTRLGHAYHSILDQQSPSEPVRAGCSEPQGVQ